MDNEKLTTALNALEAIRVTELQARIKSDNPDLKSFAEAIAEEALFQIRELE